MCMYDTFAQIVWLLAASSGMLMLALRKKMLPYARRTCTNTFPTSKVHSRHSQGYCIGHATPSFSNLHVQHLSTAHVCCYEKKSHFESAKHPF